MKEKDAPVDCAHMKELDKLQGALKVAFQNVTDAKHMGSFILGFCYIEWLASYYFARKMMGDEYKEFVQRFLPKYDHKAMYSALRCGLVHCYTDHGKEIQYDFREDRPNNHLKLVKQKGTSNKNLRVINLSNFQKDLKDATDELFNVLRENPEMATRALKRYKTVGMISGSVETE